MGAGVNQRLTFWKNDTTSMHPSVLWMSKLLFVLLVLKNFPAKIQDPFLPFLPCLNALQTEQQFFQHILTFLFFVLGIALLFNFKVRWSSSLLGALVLLVMLSSQVVYSNHNLIVGCGLFLAGLTQKEKPYLFYWQLAIIYFGAAFNKILDADWWSGAFMDAWMTNMENPFYSLLSNQLAFLPVAQLMSILAIFTEASLVVLLLIPKFRRTAIYIIILFHLGLFTFTGFRFGFFIESLFIILIGFRKWEGNYAAENRPQTRAQKFVQIFNWDGNVQLSLVNNQNFVVYLFKTSGIFLTLLLLDELLIKIKPFKLSYALSALITWALIGMYCWSKKKEGL